MQPLFRVAMSFVLFPQLFGDLPCLVDLVRLRVLADVQPDLATEAVKKHVLVQNCDYQLYQQPINAPAPAT